MTLPNVGVLLALTVLFVIVTNVRVIAKTKAIVIRICYRKAIIQAIHLSDVNALQSGLEIAVRFGQIFATISV